MYTVHDCGRAQSRSDPSNPMANDAPQVAQTHLAVHLRAPPSPLAGIQESKISQDLVLQQAHLLAREASLFSIERGTGVHPRPVFFYHCLR